VSQRRWEQIPLNSPQQPVERLLNVFSPRTASEPIFGRGGERGGIATDTGKAVNTGSPGERMGDFAHAHQHWLRCVVRQPLTAQGERKGVGIKPQQEVLPRRCERAFDRNKASQFRGKIAGIEWLRYHASRA
jgi:hypothetical protein